MAKAATKAPRRSAWPAPARNLPYEIEAGLQLPALRPPDAPGESQRMTWEQTERIWFGGARETHFVRSIPNDKEFVLKSFYAKGAIPTEVLVVLKKKFEVAQVADGGRRYAYPTGEGFVFPAGSTTVLRTVDSDGAVSYEMSGYLRAAELQPIAPALAANKLSIVARELVFDDQNRIVDRKPLAGATLAIHPENFEATQIEGGATDSDGRAMIEIKHAPLPTRPRVYFVIKSPPRGDISRPPTCVRASRRRSNPSAGLTCRITRTRSSTRGPGSSSGPTW